MQGPVEDVWLLEQSGMGACVVQFSDEDSARRCLGVMNGRWFEGRVVAASLLSRQDTRRLHAQSIGGLI